MEPPAVRLHSLTKTFAVPGAGARLIAVRDLSLEVRPGEIYGLLGPNGSGKSTTLKMIVGLARPTSGSAEVFGLPSASVAARARLGFLPENPYFYRYLGAREALVFYGRLCGMRAREARARSGDLLRWAGLGEAAGRRLATFSKGMLQRFGLAQAILHDPSLVILDEPTAGVDPAGSRQIRDLILHLRDRGITVVLSSHLLAQVQEVCDRVGILDRGRLVREGALRDLISVENQTELILEGASEGVLDEICALARNAEARVISRARPQTTLERLFLEATTPGRPPEGTGQGETPR